MYHGVLDERKGQALINANQIDVRAFRWQMEFLRDHYTVVPLAEIVRRIKARRRIDGLAAVTFDDGYFSVYENAAPLLHELSIPATIFLIAGCTETGSLTWYDEVETRVRQARGDKLTLGGTMFALGEDRSGAVAAVKARMRALSLEERDRLISELAARTGALDETTAAPFRLMGWREVADLQSELISFGVHTYTHPHLSKAAASLRREIDEAAELIAARLKRPRAELIFCYPDGDYTPEVRDRVEAIGLLGAVAVKDSLTPRHSDPFALPRVAVARDYSNAVFQDVTVGFSRWIKRSLRPGRVGRERAPRSRKSVITVS